MYIRKSASCQVYELRHTVSSSSDGSGSSSSWENSDTPLKRFNRILRTSVARRWTYFKNRSLQARGRSASDAGLCSIVDHGDDLPYRKISAPPPRVYLQVYNSGPVLIPALSVTSSGAGSVAGTGVGEEASDSDAEKPRRGHHHLRVPTPAIPTQSTGNFASGGGGGGVGTARSAPSTPLQLEPHPRQTKHEKQAVKSLSGSAISVRASGVTSCASDSAEGSKPPSKARQKKFQRHFPQVPPEERVLNYYSCALVGDLLLQGHLYITKNYFAFYSNVFGYVTKLLIPITSVLRITKEKVARIIPNAVGVCTRDERHVFGSLLSRDSTYKLMTHVWKASRVHEIAAPKPNEELRASEVELDASEYSPEDDSSSGGAGEAAGGAGTDTKEPVAKDKPDAIAAIATPIHTSGAAVIQPVLLTGGVEAGEGAAVRLGVGVSEHVWRTVLALLAALLATSALLMAYTLYTRQPEDDLLKLSGEQLYTELVRWRTRLHGRAATELHQFLNTNLLLLTKVRQSLEALSGVILSDMAAGGAPYDIDPPHTHTTFS